MGIPRVQNISITSNIKNRELVQDYRLLYFEDDLKIPMLYPVKCVTRMASKAKLSQQKD
jgi:transcription initiation factor TFIIB